MLVSRILPHVVPLVDGEPELRPTENFALLLVFQEVGDRGFFVLVLLSSLFAEKRRQLAAGLTIALFVHVAVVFSAVDRELGRIHTPHLDTNVALDFTAVSAQAQLFTALVFLALSVKILFIDLMVYNAASKCQPVGQHNLGLGRSPTVTRNPGPPGLFPSIGRAWTNFRTSFGANNSGNTACGIVASPAPRRLEFEGGHVDVLYLDGEGRISCRGVVNDEVESPISGFSGEQAAGPASLQDCAASVTVFGDHSDADSPVARPAESEDGDWSDHDGAVVHEREAIEGKQDEVDFLGVNASTAEKNTTLFLGRSDGPASVVAEDCRAQLYASSAPDFPCKHLDMLSRPQSGRKGSSSRVVMGQINTPGASIVISGAGHHCVDDAEFKFPMNVEQIDQKPRAGQEYGCVDFVETLFSVTLFTILLFLLQLQNQGQRTLTEKIAALYPGRHFGRELLYVLCASGILLFTRMVAMLAGFMLRWTMNDRAIMLLCVLGFLGFTISEMSGAAAQVLSERRGILQL
ncbi:unnamed protein product [Amoebophrya sp. A25]|nr:unnamed protein product [Amoebophrya sp. A25]|eukprot:GSA25T00017580001.1